MRDYYEHLHTNKMDNSGEMDRLLEIYTLPRLNQEEIENMNRSIASNESKQIIIVIIKKALNKWKSKTKWLHR